MLACACSEVLLPSLGVVWVWRLSLPTFALIGVRLTSALLCGLGGDAQSESGS